MNQLEIGPTTVLIDILKERNQKFLALYSPLCIYSTLKNMILSVK